MAKRNIMDTAIQHLLEIQAVKPVPIEQQGSRYYSILFVTRKAWGGLFYDQFSI